MEVQKIGHCCLLIKTGGITILTDPGNFSSAQDDIGGINIVLITHEHKDHLHIESLRRVIQNNPSAKIFTNSSVGRILREENISYEQLEGNAKKEENNVLIEAFDGKHEEIYEDFAQVQNTGYFIANKLFYPGDSFYDPGRPVDVLALPVAGPWCRIANSIRYCLKVDPKTAFPVHDGMLNKEGLRPVHNIPREVLSKNNVEFVIIEEGEKRSF